MESGPERAHHAGLTKGQVTILAGSGGNGGGGVCCARYLHNRGFKLWVLLDKEAATLTEATHSQFHILQPAGLEPTNPSQAGEVLHRSQVVMDALIGYGLQGLPRGKTAELIGLCNEREARVLSLDVPSGLDATTGEARGVVMCPERILTLALPKTGLHSVPGELYLADIGILPGVFRRLGLCFEPPFKESYCLPLVPVPRDDSPVLSGLDDQDLQRRDEMTDQATLDQECINTLRFLAVDAVQKAHSGHPGAPMGAATIAYTLWDRFLRHNPRNPAWPDRDRFILSAGHASMLLYALLHLTGYDLPLEELENFRQWGSKTPGHPEYGLTPGVELTTGPLGQGFANGVGMAIAERWLAEHYNRPGNEIINHYTYVLASDGDMQEGVSSEAASLAGTLRLGKLICLYDDNDIQIEGPTDVVFAENVGDRFRAYDWQVIGPIDGHDVSAIETALRAGQRETGRPSLIICKTVIGYGSPAQGTAKVHGEPLGEENVRAAKDTLDWPQEPPFYVPDDVLDHMRQAVERGQATEREWQRRFEAYASAYLEPAAQLQCQLRGDLPAGWDERLGELFSARGKPIATRAASGQALNALAERVHALMGGSGDLAPSTKTIILGYGDFGWHEYCGHNMHFGVREHAMGAIANGMALHGGIIPYAATFLVFSDYMRPPMRLAAMMGVQVIYVFTHDSIGLGEDGPTHQPVEQLMNLRAVPNLTVIRPADATETTEAWRAALLNTNGPTALVFTRQKLPVLDRSVYASAEGVQRGAYVLWQSADGVPDVILVGTGSETHIALDAGKQLAAEGVKVRVVSMPSWELFDRESEDYRESVLPSEVGARVAVEAGVKLGWEHYVGLEGAVVGMQSFGASAPAELLYEKFGITAKNVVSRAKALLGQ